MIPYHKVHMSEKEYFRECDRINQARSEARRENMRREAKAKANAEAEAQVEANAI